jgi:Peptidase family M28
MTGGRAFVALFSLVAFLNGCGGDDDGSSPDPTATRGAIAHETPTNSPTRTATATLAATPTATPTPAGTASGTEAPLASPTPTDAMTPTPTATGPATLTIHQELLPSTEQMVDWIAQIVAQGIRRPGYPADQWAEQWTRDQFIAFGLENVTLDPVDVKRWLPRQCSLAVWPAAAPADVTALPCFAVPYSMPTADLEQGLALPTGSVAGKIAVVDNEFLALPQTVTRAFASRTYDPDGEFDSLVQILPFSARFQNVMEPAIEAGAAGFIGIVKGLPFDTQDYYVPYDAKERSIPGVWISEANGERLKAMMARGSMHGRLVVDATLDHFTSHNVTATLPGASDEWIIVGSHHDGPWASAVEDGSGIAMVLAQACYWSRVPRRERPHNLLFLLNGGHMAGGAGLIAFVERHTDFLRNVVTEIHLEHAAREARGDGGRLVATDRPEVRWWFTSRITLLEDAVEQAIRNEDLRRSFIMPPDGFPPGSVAPPTDGAFFHPAGVPIVNFLTAPMYLFDAQDTLDKIYEPSLVPITRAAIQIINALQGRSAAELRSMVRTPAAP